MKKIPPEVWNELFLNKSKYYIRTWAEIILFIFQIEGDHVSVTREWGYMIDKTKKCNTSAIIRHKDVNLHFINGELRESNIIEYTFKNDVSLSKKAFAGCSSRLISLIGNYPF